MKNHPTIQCLSQHPGGVQPHVVGAEEDLVPLFPPCVMLSYACVTLLPADVVTKETIQTTCAIEPVTYWWITVADVIEVCIVWRLPGCFFLLFCERVQVLL